MNLENQLLGYVGKITGERPRLQTLSAKEASRLPLFLRTAYGLARLSLFQSPLLLAIQRDQDAPSTPAEYAGHARQIEAALGESPVLVLNRLVSYARDRMVRQGTSFIVPGKQMFLPRIMVDLREQFPGPVRESGERFSAPAQAVLIFHLLGNEAEDMPLRELAERVGYSPMTLCNVRDELRAGAVCDVIAQGRSRHLEFHGPRAELWRRVEGRLRSPVRARHWVRWPSRGPGEPLAGISAAASYTDLSDNDIPSFAMRSIRYQRSLERSEIEEAPGPDVADAQVEAWIYDPRILAPGPAVDRLSLYLSLRDSMDERVQKALEALLEEVRW